MQNEPRNPLYLLLLLLGLVFILTALAYAVVPVLEEKARDQGIVPPPSPLRDALREHGWKWLLAQTAAIVLVALACMGLDRYRRWRNEQRHPSPSDKPTTASNIETPTAHDDDRFSQE